MIRIIAKCPGFRRCGIAHPVMPMEYPDSRFTAEELARLQAEPMLVVDVIEGEVLTVEVEMDSFLGEDASAAPATLPETAEPVVMPASDGPYTQAQLFELTKLELDAYAQRRLLTNLPNSMNKAEMVAKILDLQSSKYLEPSIPDGVDVDSLLPDDESAQASEDAEATEAKD